MIQLSQLNVDVVASMTLLLQLTQIYTAGEAGVCDVNGFRTLG